MVESSFNGDGLKVITYTNKGGNGKSLLPTTIATFESQDAYDNYIDDLDAQVEAWDNAFVAQWNHLDDDALNDKEEELDFDSEKPLTDFENQVGLQSLRQQYLAEEEIWLNKEELNETIAPVNKSEYDFDEADMAILNKYAEVQIGTTIIKKLNEEEISAINDEMLRAGDQKSIQQVVEEGASLVISDADYDALIEFNDGNTAVIGDSNVDIVADDPFDWPIDDNTDPDPNDPVFSTCKGHKKKIVWYNTGTNRKVWTKVKIAGRRAKAKNRSYKKRRRRWKKWRTHMTVTVQGAVRPTWDCFYLEFVNKTKSGRKKRIKAVAVAPQGYRRVLKNELVNINQHNGVNNTTYLTW